jgi:hypothetical protein
MTMTFQNITFLTLLASASPMALAQETSSLPIAAEQRQQASDPSGDPSGDITVRLRTRSYSEPVTSGTSILSSADALQPDRRVTVETLPSGTANALGKFSIALPDGGIIWASEDPNLGAPSLSVSAPSIIAFDGQRIIEPVQFYVRTNYPAFIARLEVSIYRASDADLIRPLARVDMPVASVARQHWDGALPSDLRLRAGDELLYIVRAYDEDGNFDETQTNRIQLARPEDVANQNQRIRRGVEQSLGAQISDDAAREQQMLGEIFAGNDLVRQNIPIRGSRIRIQGRGLPDQAPLSINGQSYPVDLERKFVAEYLAPIGRHNFDIEIGHEKSGVLRHRLDVDVSGHYFFGVGIADLTLSRHKLSGSTQPLLDEGLADGDILADGRLAFYLKSKFEGRYLLTAQADTRERRLGDIFKGFGKADPTDIFRRLDPDLYYPIYGDDSTTTRDVDTMGRFYLRLDWDKNQALWGNYETGFTGTDLAQYIRSYYGAALQYRSQNTTQWGAPSTYVRAFGSQAQSAPGHVEFLGTGGSLYYLRHTDILPGSDIVHLDIKDRTTGRTEKRVRLVRGADYEIDEMQGRIILTRALAQITRENAPSLTRDAAIDGLDQMLIVDYEWLPSNFDNDEIAGGVRAKKWFGDHLAVGGTYVDENRAGQDYSLASGDITLQAGKGSYMKAEFARSENSTAPAFFSSNGGFSFTQMNSNAPQKGDAYSVEARANFTELGLTKLDWSAGAWWRELDAGFSSSRYNRATPLTEYGGEIIGQLAPNFGLYGRFTRAEAGAASLEQLQASADWRIDDANRLAAEVRRVDETSLYAQGAGLLGAVKYTHRLLTGLDVYVQGQLTLDNDDGAYADNDRALAGARYSFGQQSTIGAEVSTGNRGDAAMVDAEYRLNPAHSLYGRYTYSTDTTAYDQLVSPNSQNGWTVGQRWRISDQVNLFNESQSLKEGAESGLGHTYGLDFYPARGWTLGVTYQTGELRNETGGVVNRRAISVRGGHTSPDTDWQSKFEWRRDSGAEQREQWVTTNRLTHKLDESWRIAARFNYSETDDRINAMAGAKFVEGNVGFAYRPYNNNRWGLFGRYTYLYDLATLGQFGGAEVDQKSQVIAMEGVYRIDRQWELAAKVARREGEVRMGRGSGPWFDSATNFAAGQIRYEVLAKWHALAEYRILDVKDGGTRHGALLGIDRDISKNLRLGVGYNFTNFSDDLTDFDYRQRGFFVNLVGTY